MGIPRKLIVPGTEWTQDMGYIVGVAYGDGSLQNGVCLAVRDSAFAQEFARCLKTVLGRQHAVFERFRSSLLPNGKRHQGLFYEVHGYSRPLLRFIQSAIQDTFQWTRDFKIGFLQGLWDSDGYVAHLSNRHGREGWKLELKQYGKRGINVIAIACQAMRDLGFQVRMQGPYKDGAHTLTLESVGDILLFYSLIGFHVEKRREALEQVYVRLKLLQGKTCPVCGTILPLSSQTRRKNFCSKNCKQRAAWRRKHPDRFQERHCIVCGSSIHPTFSYKSQHGRKRYCSDKCQRKAQYERCGRNGYRRRRYVLASSSKTSLDMEE